MLFRISLLVFVVFVGTLTAQECEETCATKCLEECPESRICTADEIDCGQGLPIPPDFCDPVRICVSNKCQCPAKDQHGEDCPVICTPECSEMEALCTGITDSRGCKQADFCVAKATGNDGNLCPGVCPASCEADQIQCTSPLDEQGCSQSPTCVAKGQDQNGNACPGVCPTTCPDTEMQCQGGIAANGCPIADTCVAKGTDNNGELCSGSCPVACNDNEKLCHGSTLDNGCKMPDACHPKAKNTNGEYCPENSASHNCPVVCHEGETLCPGHLDLLGCKEADECKALTKDHDGNFCPATSVCHVHCRVNELSCAGGMDVNGCKKPDTCVPMGRDYEGNLCQAQCPVQCNTDEILCAGGVNENGCKEPDVCVKRELKTCGTDVGGHCSGTCPVRCGPNEIQCASQRDCDCCPTEEVCRPKHKDINGMDCPPESASHNCPKICDAKAGEVLCPAYEDHLGCKPAEVCVVKTKDKHGNDCPEHSVCPKQCLPNEILCSTGFDANDCKNPDHCIPKGTDLDGNFCPAECPTQCDSETQSTCPGRTKANGCKENDYCVAKTVGTNGDPCAEAEISRESPKILGPWIDQGTCQAVGKDPACGPGMQIQKRSCEDGTIDKCEFMDSQRAISCADAGSALPACQIEGQKSNGTKYIFWSSLDNLAEHEGNSVGDYSEKTLEECHDLCNDNDRCNSIAFKDGSCHLKDKCIDPSESQKFVEGWKTYYKECNAPQWNQQCKAQNTETSGTCVVWDCDASRGATECKWLWVGTTYTAKCFCQEGHFTQDGETCISCPAELKNAGAECWNHCNGQQGACDWCGFKGKCCRKGWDDTSNGCDGTFGGQGNHECALAPVDTTCEKCPDGTCERSEDGTCKIFNDGYHCLLGTDGTPCNYGSCFQWEGSQYYTWNGSGGYANLQVDTCYPDQPST